MKEHKHTCIAKDVAQYKKMAAREPDRELLARIATWPEFERSMTELIPTWRRFITIYLQEAHARGLEVPTRK